MNTVTSADGTPIAFDRTGDGPALVLVVGAFCDRSSTRTLAACLASTFTVYEYDRRGRGSSGDTAPYAVAREVEDLAAVLDAAGGSAFVFGHSSGAALALEAAAVGVPMDRLAVHEPPYVEGATYAFAAHLAELAAAGRHSDTAEAFLGLTGVPPAVLEQMKAAPYWSHMAGFAATLGYDVTLCNDGVLPRDRLARIAVPVLALAGGTSPAWAQDGAQAIATTVVDGRARVLDGQGHGVADDVLVPVLTGFFT